MHVNHRTIICLLSVHNTQYGIRSLHYTATNHCNSLSTDFKPRIKAFSCFRQISRILRLMVNTVINSWSLMIILSLTTINLINRLQCVLYDAFINRWLVIMMPSWPTLLFYVHVWWIQTIRGVGKWSTLGVIQTFITCSVHRPILNSSATWQTSLFTLLQCGRLLKISPRAITPLRRIMQPLNCNY